MDVWTIEGMDAQELAAATAEYKEKALAAGAKMKNIRSASKVRGDGNGELTTVLVYYETFEDMMHDITLNAQNPEIFTSSYGEVNQDARSDSFIMANNSPMPQGGGPGGGNSGSTSYLKDTDGSTFNSWNHSSGAASMPYLHPGDEPGFENTLLYYPCRTNNPTMEAGGVGGKVEIYNWEGDLLWTYEPVSYTHLTLPTTPYV